MGFFSKIFKGIKKVVKGIGKVIKKVVKSKAFKVIAAVATAVLTQGGDQNKLEYTASWHGAYSNVIDYFFKRAPSFYDIVCYDGSGSNRTINHNLGAAPEMMWVKPRETGSASSDWWVFNKDLSTPADDSLVLNSTGAPNTGNGALLWNSTMPTSSVFSLGTYNGINQSGRDFIACLFATLDGVSKVGNYTGNGSAMTIDCGFSSGARFVLIKRTDTTDNWYVWDSARGIVAGNDPYLRLNTTQAEATSADYIDPHSSGFALPNDYFTVNGRTFIFYAIA